MYIQYYAKCKKKFKNDLITIYTFIFITYICFIKFCFTSCKAVIYWNYFPTKLFFNTIKI